MPQATLVPQPFFVLTERDGRQVRYRFELSTVPYGQGVYSVRLRNVAAEDAQRRARWAAGAEQRAEAAARDRLRQTEAAPCTGANVNFRYMGQGDAAIAPAEVCDDGRTTFLRFPGVSRVPMAYTTLPDGRLAVANTSGPNPQGWMRVHGTSRVLQLMDGGRTLCLVNHGYAATGTNTGTGTVLPDVVREARPQT
jgi:type IV secretory pathway VirB9-like protein